MKTRFGTLVILLITLLGGGVVLAIFVPPALTQIAVIATEQASLQETLADLEQQRTPLTALVANRAANHALAERLATLLPATADGDGLVLYLDQTSRANGSTATTISITDPAVTKKTVKSPLPAGVSDLVASLEVVGNFASIQQFISALENGGRLLDIRQVGLSLSSDGQLHAVIDSRAFFKLKPTLALSSRTLTIADDTRAAYVEPTPVPPPAPPSTGRPDPFADVK